tara:strand:- start:4069 stop:6057 length:1989 start_codon:yes stop_codon:yes gene_type:complete
MYKKILIANRGEIACRIIRSAKDLGIGTVAIYSDADKGALHVEIADEAFYIGDSAATKSYLCSENILEAVRKSNSDAVHPGYGFMSENADFVSILNSNGIEFIGPSVDAIRAMGDKITSKKIAAEADVSTVPGHMGIIDSIEEAKTIALEIGYPVMVKASAGGGGKGMRVVRSEKDLSESFEISKRESASSFGDDRVFIEKFIENPRHIEIQVIGDKFGNYVHLGERECSIQRRNQKVIEEAPSPFLDADVRNAMGKQAIALARQVKYHSAGTVEFIVDSEQKFYFLEMNTRLQVEHPVTELITGIDIVKEMISISSGNQLSVKQDEISLNGWAIESRVYAEDPLRNFLPSTGRLTKYKSPESVSSKGGVVRNDSGVREGDRISLFYDPMLSKLCTWAKDRKTAIKQMSSALDNYEIEGIQTNISFLSALCEDSDFIKGYLHTGFIQEKFPEGFKIIKPGKQRLLNILSIVASVDLIAQFRYQTENISLGSAINRSAYYYDGSLDFEIMSLDKETFSVKFHGETAKKVEVNWTIGKSLVKAKIDGKSIVLKVARINSIYQARFRGSELKCLIIRKELTPLFNLMPKKQKDINFKVLNCPMPGLLVSLNVSIGEKVEEGQALCIVEAMKMENVLYAEQPGVIKKINFVEGDILSLDDKIIEFE